MSLVGEEEADYSQLLISIIIVFQSPPRLFAIKPRWRHHGAKEFNFNIINLLIVNLTIGAIYSH